MVPVFGRHVEQERGPAGTEWAVRIYEGACSYPDFVGVHGSCPLRDSVVEDYLVPTALQADSVAEVFYGLEVCGHPLGDFFHVDALSDLLGLRVNPEILSGLAAWQVWSVDPHARRVVAGAADAPGVGWLKGVGTYMCSVPMSMMVSAMMMRMVSSLRVTK